MATWGHKISLLMFRSIFQHSKINFLSRSMQPCNILFVTEHKLCFTILNTCHMLFFAAFILLHSHFFIIIMVTS